MKTATIPYGREQRQLIAKIVGVDVWPLQPTYDYPLWEFRCRTYHLDDGRVVQISTARYGRHNILKIFDSKEEYLTCTRARIERAQLSKLGC